jgi:hypothetical protein
MVLKNKTKIQIPTSTIFGLPNINYTKLKQICRKKTKDFHSYGKKVECLNGLSYFYKDNGSNILAVGHLDSVQGFRNFNPVKLPTGQRIYCSNLDDRLGVYLIVDYLQKELGIQFDILLTDGEEKGQSTARYFKPPPGKEYNWMFQFDRTGSGAVLYKYHGLEIKEALTSVGIDISTGSYSDICELEKLECKGINFGTAYYDYHGVNAYVERNELLVQIGKFVDFYKIYKDTKFSHTPRWNSFSFEDGFSYKYREGTCFSQEEIDFGKKLLKESKDYTLAKSAFTSTIAKEEMAQMMRYRKQFPEYKFGRLSKEELEQKVHGSEDNLDLFPDSKKNTAIIHYLTTPDERRTAAALVTPQRKGYTAFVIQKCSKCGREHSHIKGEVSGLCPTCSAIAKAGKGKEAPLLTLEQIAENVKRAFDNKTQTKELEPSFKVGGIRTKIAINLRGVQLEYKKSNNSTEWNWKTPAHLKDDKVKVGFQLPEQVKKA